SDEAIDRIKFGLMPRADLITPNAQETAILSGSAHPARDLSELEAQGRVLLDAGARAVLLKGGHLDKAQATDLLMTRDGAKTFTSPRVQTQNTHGTGCTLSAAITASLAKVVCDEKANLNTATAYRITADAADVADMTFDRLGTAVSNAKAYLDRALMSAAPWQLGRGHGPVDHRVAAQ
ncbi:MAG: PfkB family carbohydrate kinase, partial [Pseudomonadota bacterium]